MMNYNEFKNEATANFLSYMPEKYQGMTLQTVTCRKVNRTLDGINLIGSGDGAHISPTIYINDMYEEYINTRDFEAVMGNFARAMDDAFSDLPSAPNLDRDIVKDHVIFQLVNTVQNEELLKEVPHRSFQDLSVIYRYVLQLDENGIASIVINDHLADTLNLLESELYRLAVLNTRQLIGLDIRSMRDILREMPEFAGLEEIPDSIWDSEPDCEMYVITNSYRTHGAASIMYHDVLDSLAERLGDNLFILPSSIHEMIAVTATRKDPAALADMVAEVNMAQVELPDRLSNQVYYYDRETRTLSRATDTPNKRLDQLVA